MAKRVAKSQHEQPETERCRFLVDVAQKLSKKFCRDGGKWWQVVADGGRWELVGGMAGAGLCFAECKKLSEFDRI